MTSTSLKQSHAIMGIFANNADWTSIDFDALGLQDRIVRNPEEAGRLFTLWLKNGCQLSIKGPSVLTIDRAKPFDSVKFIGKGSSIAEEDARALALTEIDFSKVLFVNGLTEDESAIDGEEKLKRLSAMPEIRLDAKIGQALFEEKG